MGQDEGVLQELDAAADAFAARSLGARRGREARTLTGGFDRAMWKQFAELGWLGILVPEQYGGLELGLREMAVVAQRLAFAIMPEPLSACAVLASQVLLVADNEGLKSELLSNLCSGRVLPTVAWQEQPGQVETDPTSTWARQEGNLARLSGTKICVPYADVADGFIIPADSDSGLGLYWVHGRQGTTIETRKLADGSTHATVRFDDASAAVLRSPEGKSGFGSIDAALDSARIIAGAELLGVMEACLSLTLEYLRTRTQFGKPIGSFQALQHRAVDLYIQKELSRSALDAALVELDGKPSNASRAAAASRVKARCSDAALLIARESIQMHGAIGWTDECDLSLCVKRALLLSAWLGNGVVNRRRYARVCPSRPMGLEGKS